MRDRPAITDKSLVIVPPSLGSLALVEGLSAGFIELSNTPTPSEARTGLSACPAGITICASISVVSCEDSDAALTIRLLQHKDAGHLVAIGEDAHASANTPIRHKEPSLYVVYMKARPSLFPTITFEQPS